MRLLSVILWLAFCLVAPAQTLNVQKLVEFIHSAAQRNSDKEVADYLGRVKLSERLDDRTIEELQSTSKVGPRTLHALWALRDQSKALTPPKPVGPAPVIVEPPPPSAEQQAAILADVRDYALNYSKNLPDFICTEVVSRSGAPKNGAGGEPQWRDLDTLQIKLSYFEQKEQYKLLMINNSLTTKDYEAVGGAKSFGDFGSLMRGIFEPDTQAHFEWLGWRKLRGQDTMAFTYHVDQGNSRYDIRYEDGRHIVPAYSGRVLVDKDSHAILRVTVKADNIPAGFPIHSAETVLDYDFTDLSGHPFLLPMQSVVTMSGDDHWTRNSERFAIYRKYSADTNIKFDTDTEVPPPLPDSKTKEIKK